MTKQEKLGIVNFILTIVAIILIKYLSMYIPWLPTASDGTVEMIPLAVVTIIAVLIIHAATWIILWRYFDIAAEKNSKIMLIVYEVLFLLSLAVLYVSAAYDFLPEFISKNMMAGIGLFVIIQMALSIFFTYSISKMPMK
ncbi:hypothetical protein [Methanimicrococcus hongohii]|uniref:hypothetical protein n=1 Tax=Methanimicrococcus hongohii TaxID=3028295 RepID=UPI002930F910|nr:hypothetical protein [Methanimicrococcus sp. Hf6]